jgi:hypothetical protein
LPSSDPGSDRRIRESLVASTEARLWTLDPIDSLRAEGGDLPCHRRSASRMKKPDEDVSRRKASESDAEIEREVRSRRRFSLAEAIGRTAGDLLRGASPVTRRRQAEFEIQEFLETHLVDAEGALGPSLLRDVRESETLLSRLDDPLSALRDVLDGILGSDQNLRRFVREVDAEWGRIYLERPRFDVAARPSERDDPYTLESVAQSLRVLLGKLDELSGRQA